MERSARNHRSLALLVCGKTTGKTYAENGDYIDIFTRFLHASLDAVQGPQSSLEKSNHDPRWQFTLDPYDVVKRQEYPTEEKLNDYHGVIITGSPAAAYENVEWVNKLLGFVKHLAEDKPQIKLIGICFGHQIIARALGGSCVPNGGRWEIGPTPVALTELGQRVFGVESLNIQEMHRDHVPSEGTPSGFELLGSTELSPNQGMVRFLPSSPDNTHGLFASIQIITTQGHPEFTEPIVTSLVETRSESGVIDVEAARDCERRRFWRNDGVDVIGRAVWGVLGISGDAVTEAQ
ncbi:class I glutamine amidotransferase-like protein [Coprinellus micaceus]|uniref:Class I glutamine amidotransferase-like protein n=1 Tax=Coprinellus micaceus TaxID=71717 RepID=A0A4Y7T681_COPMI|nr:class I glutamine amidotransferase-like protein [Coprinellus micaceus]